MAIPRPSWWTLEELAARWGFHTVGQIHAMADDGKLELVIRPEDDPNGRPCALDTDVRRLEDLPAPINVPLREDARRAYDEALAILLLDRHGNDPAIATGYTIAADLAKLASERGIEFQRGDRTHVNNIKRAAAILIAAGWLQDDEAAPPAKAT